MEPLINFYEISYEQYVVTNHPNLVLFSYFPKISNESMAESRTYEVRETTVPINIGF